MKTKTKRADPSLRKIYFTVAFCNILVNLDHGIIPAATKEIKIDLNIAEVELGLLGSIVYGGLLLGSLVAGQTFQRFTSKSIIIFTVAAYILSLLMFPVSKNILFLGLSRFLVGFFQVNYSVFRVFLRISGVFSCVFSCLGRFVRTKEKNYVVNVFTARSSLWSVPGLRVDVGFRGSFQ